MGKGKIIGLIVFNTLLLIIIILMISFRENSLVSAIVIGINIVALICSSISLGRYV
jgi:hypothetical protein